jgi:beta-phosphoglucomutase-like phosphatase (HAD superfamily)
MHSIDGSAVVLDVDGTLIDPTPQVERIWRAWSAEPESMRTPCCRTLMAADPRTRSAT